MIQRKCALLLTLLFSLILSTQSFAFDPQGKPIAVRDSEIKVMAYNAENLFDAQHQDGKDDYTFLPLGYPGKTAACNKMPEGSYKKLCEETDWTESKFQLKLRQIKKVLDAQGVLPDVLSIEEIESDYAAKSLSQVLGYQRYLITTSPDVRGVNVALFYNEEKIQYIDHEEIVLKGGEFDTKPTRNILRAGFRILGKANAGKVLGVYVNHWPSQASGPWKRVATAKFLKNSIDQQVQKYGKASYYVIAMGDFNTLEAETPNAFDTVISDSKWDNALVDVQKFSFENGNPNQDKMPPNSYFAHGSTWAKLDRMLVSKNWVENNPNMTLMTETFEIFVAKFMCKMNVKTGCRPFGYDFSATHEADAGHSDHMPLIAKFKIQ